jgi:NAD(P)-dependent dehydrogenase (short-subunit alcohol dehydrogenase family)
MTGRALVAGGTGRIGTAVVRALAARGYGVAIHCHGALPRARALAAELEAAGVPALAVTADFREEGAVRAAVHRVTDHFSGLDAFVSCVARRRPLDLVEATAADVRSHFEVDCVGPFVAAQEAALTMAGQETGGTIVLVAEAEAAAPAAWAASQAALPALARTLAAGFAARHPRIRVECITRTAESPDELAAVVVGLLAAGR